MATVLFSGCAAKHKSGVYGDVNDALGQQSEWQTKPYQSKIKPYIGTRQNDAKVVLDHGKVLKVWIAPYKQARTLIAAHDIYTIVEKPQFIMGEMVPSRQRTGGAITCNDDYPFVFKDRHLENVNPEDRFKDNNIKEYVNNVYKAQGKPGVYDKKRAEANKRYNDAIKDYIK